MSGICGLYNLDNKPASSADIAAITAALRYRGPDAEHSWLTDNVAFGHTLLTTTNASRNRSQPFVHVESGCVITADIRIDNRPDLLDALECHRPDDLDDPELAVLAYLKWGEDSPKHLVGDFAFAIWDPRDKIIFGARDGFGMRHFYYHYAGGKRFIFASSPRAILVLPQVPYQVNEGRIADFLVPELQWIDYTSTFFEDVFRLPPGHSLTVTTDNFEIREYWRPEPGPELGSLSDDQYREGFLDVFEKAVDARLRAPANSVGSMLSGGMDSGTVTVVASNLRAGRGEMPLPTFSAARQPAVDCDESRGIHAAARMPAIDPTIVYPEELAARHDELVTGYDEPFDANFVLLKALYLAAQKKGLRILLDGGGGDIVLNEGAYINRLIRRGQLGAAWHAIKGQSEYWEGPPLPINVGRFMRSALTPQSVKRLLRPFRRKRYVERSLEESIISRELASRVDIPERFARYWELQSAAQHPDPAIERCNKILPNALAGRERYARVAASVGMEARDPFMDKRVVEYCARLPGRLLLKNGWPKSILRDLMQDKLPDEILSCTGKPHIGWIYYSQVRRQALEQGELRLTELKDTLAGYIDPDHLDNAWQNAIGNDDFENLQIAHALSLWIKENVKRPVVEI